MSPESTNSGRRANWVSTILLLLSPVFGYLIARELKKRQINAISDVPIDYVVWAIVCICVFALAYLKRRVLIRRVASAWWSSAEIAKRAFVAVFAHKRIAKRELLALGYSSYLPTINPNKCRNRTLPFSCFQYSAFSLTQGLRPSTEEVSDPLAVNGTAVKNAENQGWCMYGPYIRLARAGRYLVVFRVRRLVRGGGPKPVHFDIAHFDPSTKKHPPYGPCADVSFPDGAYKAVAIAFDYQCEEGVEFRINHKKLGTEILAIDRISVLRLGKSGARDWRTIWHQDVKKGTPDANTNIRVGPLTTHGPWRISYGTRPARTPEGHFRIRVYRQGETNPCAEVADVTDSSTVTRNTVDVAQAGAFEVAIEAKTRWWWVNVEVLV